MKKILLSYFVSSVFCFGQVGIGTDSPKATLDVSGMPENSNVADGFLAPRLSASQLRAKDNVYTSNQNGNIVFVNETDNIYSPKTINVSSTGFYYYNHPANQQNGVWVKVGDDAQKNEFFYMPSILLPTNDQDSRILDNSNDDYTLQDDIYTIDLYDLFKLQFSSPIVTSSSESLVNASILQEVVLDRDDYHYVVTYADTSVFDDVNVQANGILTYKVQDNAIIRNGSFMNIVLKVR